VTMLTVDLGKKNDGPAMKDLTSDRLQLQIFISSPSDVRPERLIAQRVVERMNREFSYHFRVRPILWEREPLIATEHFQTSITPPHQTDIVVVILWSRLGVSPACREVSRLDYRPAGYGHGVGIRGCGRLLPGARFTAPAPLPKARTDSSLSRRRRRS
jgi:hypothetical protein